MYEAFYGFKEKPFSMLPDPGFLFLSKKHQAALTLLEYGLLNHVGFCVISGEPGAGKTTILRALLERVDDDTTVGLITNTHQSFGGLLDWILSVFDLHRADLTHVEMHQIFMEFLIEEYANNRTVLLIVDEAQNMNADSLEELRMLSNVNSEKDQLLQVVLSGQPALKDMLRRPELMQFAQRIAVDYHLDSLNVEETCGYIQHRLVTAGAEKDVFTPAACGRIYNYSGGTPRLINLLCETVLVYGFADQQEMIDVDLVEEMVHERMKDSVVPLVNRDIANQDDAGISEELEKNFPWIRPQAAAQATEKISESVSEPEPVEQPELEIESAPDEKQTETEHQVVEKPMASVAATSVDVQPSEVRPKSIERRESSLEKKPEEVPEEVPEQATEVASKKPVSAEPEITGKPLSASAKVARKKTAVSAGKISRQIPAVENKAGNETRTQLIKYGVIAALFGLVLIVLAIALEDDINETRPEVTNNDPVPLQDTQPSEQSQQLIDAEEERLQQQGEAALVKTEEEKHAREAADKLAAEKQAQQAAEQAAAAKQLEKEKAVIAAKAQQEKLLRDEKRRKAIQREKAREAKYAAQREKRKTAKLEEAKLLKEKEEARRLELEWLESERQAQTKKP